MEQEKDTQKIFFRDLIFAALYRWKAFFAFVVIFALLLGGFALLGEQGTVTLAGTTMTPEKNLVVEQLKITLANQKKDIAQQTDYIQNSVLMSIDAYATYTASLLVFVTPENYEIGSYDPSVGILYSYKGAIIDEETIGALAQQYGIPAKYFRELVTSTVPGDSYLELTVRANTAEAVQNYITDLEAALRTKQAEIAASTAPHTITVSSFYSGPKYDSALYSQQNTTHQRLKNTKAEYATNESELNRLLPTAMTSGESSPVLFAIIGAFLGGFLVVCYAWVAHIASAKVYSARTLTVQTGIRVLGCVADTAKRDPVTRWLRKLEGRSDNQKLDAVTANIRNRCQNVKTLLIMGDYREDTVNTLTQGLEQAGISCVLCKDPYLSADALEALPGCDAVILAETCGKTRYDRVTWAKELAEDHGKTLLGCVLING